MLESLLSVVDFSILAEGYKIGLNWLGQFARVIIEGVGIIGLGIIVFTLVLKAITLPFDIYQRVTMRKQNLIMKDMKEDLEKLQKQYANDKTVYNQKMMELYKKNGYSMFGACLPMILSLVILIVAFQGFRTYSQFANLDIFVGMSNSYNAAILEHSADGTDYTLLRDEEGNIVVNDGDVYTVFYYIKDENGNIVKDENKEPVKSEPFEVTWAVGSPLIEEESEITYTMSEVNGSKYLEVREEGKPLFYIYNLEAETVVREYKIDTDVLYVGEAKADIDEIMQTLKEDEANADTPEDKLFEAACRNYIVKIGSGAAKVWYHDNSPSFLWVKNVWYPDVSYSHPIPNYSNFKSQLNVKVTLASGEKVKLTSVISEGAYANLTSELAAEKSQPNGYFILIALSIGMMVLSQLIIMKSQKETNQYQTVDGQGARTQKMMLVMMPMIYAIFAFTYSAAFSIYMTMSSVIALLITLISNFIIGKIFKKKEEEKIRTQYGHRLAWKEEGKNKSKKK